VKKTLIFFAVLALSAVIFTSVSRKNTSSDFTFLAMDFYDVFSAETENEFYTTSEKFKNEICYTNAKTTDKYRLMSLLNYVENHRISTNAENIRADVLNIFGSCRTISEGEYYGGITRIYNKYLAAGEGECNEGSFFPENRIFHPPEKKKADNVFSLTASEIREKSSFLSAVVCEGFGERYEVSPDGTVWLYGENCAFSLSEEFDPRLLVIQKRGINDGLRLHSFRSKNVFSRLDLICEGNIIKAKDFRESFITAEFDELSGFVSYDFSSYNFPVGSGASFGRN